MGIVVSCEQQITALQQEIEARKQDVLSTPNSFSGKVKPIPMEEVRLKW